METLGPVFLHTVRFFSPVSVLSLHRPCFGLQIHFVQKSRVEVVFLFLLEKMPNTLPLDVVRAACVSPATAWMFFLEAWPNRARTSRKGEIFDRKRGGLCFCDNSADHYLFLAELFPIEPSNT